MDLFFAIFLGIVQGLTEFLPVSSSGHLMLLQALIPNFSQPGVLFDAFLHLGTLFAVIFFFRNVILKIDRYYIMAIILATLPAAILGLLFSSQLEKLFTSTKTLALQFLVSAIFNFAVDKDVKISKVAKKRLGLVDSLLIGVSQAISILPGISRSGATIFSGVGLGISEELAIEFSFLISIPAILGANFLEFQRHGLGRIENPHFYILGFVSSFVSGFLAIGLVKKFLLSKRFRFFGYYCLFAALVSFLIFFRF